MNRARFRKRRRLIFGLGGVCALVLIVFMIRVGVDADLFVQPTDISAKGIKVGETFRLGGMVEKGSYQMGEDGLTHMFKVTDCKTTITVHFKGLMPSLFREGQGAIAEGALSEPGLFISTRVLAKHDENYEAKGTKPKAAVQDGTCQHPDDYSF